MNFSYNIPIFNNINIPNVQFRSSGQIITTPQELRKDSFNSNPLYDNFVDKNMLTHFDVVNPMHISGNLKWGIVKGSAVIDASWKQTVTFKY